MDKAARGSRLIFFACLDNKNLVVYISIHITTFIDIFTPFINRISYVYPKVFIMFCLFFVCFYLPYPSCLRSNSL